MKKVTVSVGIPVYNEVDNINYLLESIIRQKHTSYILEKIIVVCDGSTDGTDRKVKEKSKKNPAIVLVNDGKRKGKIARLEQLYNINESDIITIFDGDVLLANKQVLDNIVKNFKDKNVSFVGANSRPSAAEKIIEKVINTWSECWYETRRNYKNGENIFNVLSCSIALRKSFAKKISFPKGIISDGQIVYLSVVRDGFNFRFAKDALVLFRSEDNLKDYMLRLSRFNNDRKIQLANFGKWIDFEYKVPFNKKINGIFTVFRKKPILTILAIIFHYMTLYLSKNNKNKIKNTNSWEIISSTKKPINSSKVRYA